MTILHIIFSESEDIIVINLSISILFIIGFIISINLLHVVLGYNNIFVLSFVFFI